MVYSLQQPSNPYLEYYTNNWVDMWVWWWLQIYFAKYKLPEQAGDFEKFLASFSLNGVKSSNICRPS